MHKTHIYIQTMNTRDLAAFVAVVDTGSIVAAALRLHLTQPGVTRRIQGLEQELGAVLLDRQSKPLRPTLAGREAYRLGRRLLQAEAELRDHFATDGEHGGELRLGVPHFISQLVLAEPLDRLRADHPALSLRVTTGWSPHILEQLKNQALDCAVLVVPEQTPAPDKLVVHVLARLDVVVVAPPALDLPGGPLDLADLAPHAWVLNQDGCGLRLAVRQAFERAGLPLQIAVEAPTVELQLSLVERGLGLGLVTEAQLAGSRATVRRLEVPGFRPRADVWLAHETAIGRLAAPIALLRETLADALKR
jgi:DNA-binding transcriptional LysR family regulator